MNTPNHNPNNQSAWHNKLPSRSSKTQPLRLGITRTAAGWRVDISSLSPSKTTSFARTDLLESSTILCRSNAKCTTFSTENTVHIQEYDDALALVAKALANYASCLLSDAVALPELGLVDRILERTGHISINPIETECFSTFVDIGICTSASDEPANLVLIYDIPSDTWHGD